MIISAVRRVKSTLYLDFDGNVRTAPVTMIYVHVAIWMINTIQLTDSHASTMKVPQGVYLFIYNQGYVCKYI